MEESSKTRIHLLVAVSFAAAGYLVMLNNVEIQEEAPVPQMHQAAEQKSRQEIRKEHLSSSHIPQFKDPNGVCGVAESMDGSRYAVASADACPTQEALEARGYSYISLTEGYSPEPQEDGTCGTAHFVAGEARMGTKDMAKLDAITQGNLEAIPVNSYEGRCPTQPELSDMITNSVGVPVRFEYNDFNANPEMLPLLDLAPSPVMLEARNEDDEDISEDGPDGISKNGVPVPKILRTKASLAMCENDYFNCTLDKEDMVLRNPSTGKEFRIWTRNGFPLPKFMMTKGGLKACGGSFQKCDYTPDPDMPLKRGTVTDPSTGASYTSKEIAVITEAEPQP